MSFTAQQTIALRAPQWSADPRIAALTTYCQQGLSAEVFGDRYGEAIGLKVLHILALEYRNGGNPGTGTSGGSGTGGAVTAEREGDLSRSYSTGQASGSWDDLDSTQYGQELKRLMRSTILSPLNRRM